MMATSQFFTVPSGGTYLSNEVIKNKNLTYDALGLLLAMLAMHPAQAKTRDTLTGRGLGRRAVANALRVLEDAGFRYRYKYVLDDGQWRTATVLFDAPHTPQEAFVVVQSLVNSAVVSHVRSWHDGEGVRLDETGVPLSSEPISAGRTEVPEAVPRSYEPVDNSKNEPIAPSRDGEAVTSSDVHLPSSHRGTGYRPSVSGTLNISKDIFSNNSKELSSNQPATPNVTSSLSPSGKSCDVAGVAESESVSPSLSPASGDPGVATGARAVPTPDQPTPADRGVMTGRNWLGRRVSKELSADEFALLTQAIPSPLVDVLGYSGCHRVLGMIRDAQSSGWTCAEIYKRLNELGGLDGASNPAGLVIYRLSDVLSGTPPVSREQVLKEREKTLNAASRDLDQIIAGTSPLSAREQALRVNGYANSGAIMRELTAKIEQAEQALADRSRRARVKVKQRR